MLHKILIGTVGMVLVLLVCAPASARAERQGKVVSCVVEGNSGSCEIAVHRDILTAVQFSSPVVTGYQPRPMRNVVIQRRPTGLFVRPTRKEPGRLLGNMVVMTSDYWVSLRLILVDIPEEADHAVEVTRHDPLEERIASLEAAHAEELRTLTEEHRSETGELRRLLEQEHARRIADLKARLLDRDLVPVVSELRGDGAGVQVSLGRAVWSQGELWASFTIRNDSPTPYELVQVQVTDAKRKLFAAEQVSMRIGDQPPAIEEEPLLAVVAPGREVQGIVHIPDTADGYGPRALSFLDTTGARMLRAAVDEWVFVPKRPEELEAEKRRKAEEERERAARGHKTLLVSAGGGALQLERDDGSALVGAWDVGGQLIYSLGTMFSVDVGLSRLASGETEIAGVMRSEAIYRVQIGGRLRLGERGWVPYMRVGAGAALVSQQDGDASSVAFRLFGLIGAGVVFSFADTAVIGVELTGERHTNASVGVASAYLGFTWDSSE